MITILHGTARHWPRLLRSAGMLADAVVCDPPYELGFMGKRWDSSGIAFDPELWRGVLDGAKPGAHLLAFGGTRTYHRMVCAIEDAGWEVRDSLQWIYASGFPKSLDVSKAIDGHLGNTRPDRTTSGNGCAIFQPTVRPENRGTPITTEARRWNGWGTALKPAHEPIVLARKPLVGTVAANVIAHGTGGLNVDGCRVEGAKPDTTRGAGGQNGRYGPLNPQGRIVDDGLGRWPPNVLLDPGAAELLDADSGERPGMSGGGAHREGYGGGMFGAIDSTNTARGDSGGASRFFPVFKFCPKADRAERERGCERLPPKTGAEATASKDGQARLNSPRAGAGRTGSEIRNHHATVKPVELMRWLVRLVTPPGGLVLDPFAGSGTTGVACALEGFRFIGIELEAEHVDIARARIAHVTGGHFEPATDREMVEPKQRSLF